MKKPVFNSTKDSNTFLKSQLTVAETKAIKGGDDTTETIVIVDIVID